MRVMSPLGLARKLQTSFLRMVFNHLLISSLDNAKNFPELLKKRMIK